MTISYLPDEKHECVVSLGPSARADACACASAEHVVEQIEAAGSKGIMVPLDLRDGPDAVTKFVSAHQSESGEKRIDILVNNASTQIQCKDLKEIDMANVDQTLKVNVAGMINMTKEVIKHMVRGGNIVNSSSVTAFKGSGGMVDYSCAPSLSFGGRGADIGDAERQKAPSWRSRGRWRCN